MSLFTVHFNKNLIYILIYWILEILIRLTMHYRSDHFQISEDPKENEYMFVTYPVISKLLSGFLILYIYCILHKKKKEKVITTKNELIYENRIIQKTKYYYLKLLRITVLEIIVTSSNFIYFLAIDASEKEITSKKTKDALILLDILVRYVLSIFMLKIKIYKHHRWSIYAMIFGFLLIIPFDILDVYYEENTTPTHTAIYIIILLFQSFIYPLEDTYIKLFFNSYYVQPENLLFSVAVFEFLILSIITLILYFVKILTFHFIMSVQVIVTISLYILATTVREYILMKIIYLYSSQSISFLIISQNISVSIIDIITFFGKEQGDSIGYHIYLSFPFEIIALIIIIFATSVYDEILIINKFGLNLNVKKGIIKRAEIETESISIEHSIPMVEMIDDNDTEA